MVVINLIRKLRLREDFNSSSSYRKGSSGNADPDFTKIQSILDLVRNGGGLERSQRILAPCTSKHLLSTL